MTLTLSHEPEEQLKTPANANRTSDYDISEDARAAYAAAVVDALELVDDLTIALEIKRRAVSDEGERTELYDFIREQGYDPADFEA